MTTYTKTEFAKRIGVSRQTVYRWIANGIIDTVKVPDGWNRIPESEVTKFRGDDDD